MRYWRNLLFRIRSVLGRKHAERERLEEMEFHLMMETEKNVRSGMEPKEARRQARAAFGSMVSHREALRDGRGFPRLGAVARDLRLALRSHLRSPWFTAIIVVTLAIGIASTSATFSAVHEVLIRPLPYGDPDRLVVVTSRHEERGIEGANVSHPDFLSWRDEVRSLDGLGVYTGWSGTLLGEGPAELIWGAALSPEVFSVLDVQPVLGRGFRSEDSVDPQVVVLGHSLWNRRFASDPDVVGKGVTLDGTTYTVVGVMPPAFRFPYWAEAWVPMAIEEPHRQREARFLTGAIGRLKPGMKLQEAQADLNRVSDRLAVVFPDSNDGWGAQLTPLLQDVVGPLGPALWIVQSAAALVLLVVCGNVAGLLLARGLRRRQEFAVRCALGAGRRRLVALLVTESLVLAGMGILASLPLLLVGVNWLRNLLVDRFAVITALEVRPQVLIFTLVSALVATLLFGVLPAWAGSRLGVSDLGGERTGETRSTGRVRKAFVVAQLALVVTLLAGAALLIRSIRALDSIDLGFDVDGEVSATVDLPSSDYPDADTREVALDEMLRKISAMPGVEATAVAQGLPFGGWNVHRYYQIEGQPTTSSGEESVVHAQAVGTGFFELLDIDLLRGRPFHAGDRTGPPVGIVTESFARRHFGDGDPLGRRLRFGSAEWLTIVGVVGDFRHFDLTSATRPAVYVPWQMWSPTRAVLILRTGREFESLSPDLRSTLAEVAPNVAPYEIGPLRQILSYQTFHTRLVRDLLTGFATVSAVLALIGLYGVISFGIACRRRELGVRVSLGATPASLARDVVGQGLRLSAWGILAGLVVATAVSGFLSSLLYRVEARDPVTLAGIALLVLGLSICATAFPAWRVSNQDPTAALRES
ncbi:MAG: ABC transporter permease [Thermoanaerobaculia bacterium]|nr:ABC transporter permease [Thermoanaerobaculia bacterium]